MSSERHVVEPSAFANSETSTSHELDRARVSRGHDHPLANEHDVRSAGLVGRDW